MVKVYGWIWSRRQSFCCGAYVSVRSFFLLFSLFFLLVKLERIADMPVLMIKSSEKWDVQTFYLIYCFEFRQNATSYSKQAVSTSFKLHPPCFSVYLLPYSTKINSISMFFLLNKVLGTIMVWKIMSLAMISSALPYLPALRIKMQLHIKMNFRSHHYLKTCCMYLHQEGMHSRS